MYRRVHLGVKNRKWKGTCQWCRSFLKESEDLHLSQWSFNIHISLRVENLKVCYVSHLHSARASDKSAADWTGGGPPGSWWDLMNSFINGRGIVLLSLPVSLPLLKTHLRFGVDARARGQKANPCPSKHESNQTFQTTFNVAIHRDIKSPVLEVKSRLCNSISTDCTCFVQQVLCVQL